MALSGEQIIAGIVLRVDSRGVERSTRKVKKRFTQVEIAARKATKATNGLRSAFTGLAMGATSLGVITGAGAMMFGRLAGAAIGAAQEFQTNMKLLSFTAQLDEATDKFKEMRALALKTGRDTAFSPAEAGEGLRLMVAAGLSADQAMQTLLPTLNLVAASAGRIDLATGAKLVASTLKKFGLEASEATRVVDMMAKATTRSNIQFEDLTGIIDAMGGVPAMYGTKLEEALAMAGAMTNVGISARESGQTIKGLFRFIGRAAKFEAADFFGAKSKGAKFFKPFLKGVDLTTKDLFENGKLLGTHKIITKIMASMQKLPTEELRIGAATAIFGDQARAALAAFEKMTISKDGKVLKGMEAFDELLGNIIDSSGTAEAAAKKFLFGTFEGARKFLAGSLQTIATQILEPTVLPALAKIFQTIAFAVNKVGALVEASPLFRDILGFALVGVPAVLALLTAFFGLVAILAMGVAGFLAMKAAIVALPILMTAMGVSFGGIAAAFGLVFIKVIAAIALAVLAVKILKTAWDNDFGGMATGLKKFWGKASIIFQALRQFMGDRTVGKGLFDSMTPGMKKVFFWFTQMHDRFMFFWRGLKSGLAEAGPGLTAMGDAIGAAFSRLFDVFSSLFELFGFKLEKGGTAFETFGMVVGVILSTIVEVFALAIEAFAIILEKWYGLLNTGIVKLTIFKTTVGVVMSAVSLHFKKAFNWAKKLFNFILKVMTPATAGLNLLRTAMTLAGFGDQDDVDKGRGKMSGLKPHPLLGAPLALPQSPGVTQALGPVPAGPSQNVTVQKMEIHANSAEGGEKLGAEFMNGVNNAAEEESERTHSAVGPVGGVR